MFKVEHVITPSAEEMEFIIEGMRNPLNSWNRQDSEINGLGYLALGENDAGLMKRLSDAGTEHRKYLRMMQVYARITLPLYVLKELDTYKIGTTSNSCSTMHKIQAKEFTREDFSCEHLSEYSLNTLDDTIKALNHYRERYLETKNKDDWWQMIQLLPSSYNQTRNFSFSYEALASIYKQRRHHKLDEWHDFCDWIETLPYADFITKN